MLFLELAQHVCLARIVTRRPPQLLLPLIPHHLLDHAARLAVQVAQLAVLGRDFRCVDRVGRVGHDRRPPLHLVGFVEVEGDFFGGRGGGGGERPGGFVCVDSVREGTLGLGVVGY